MQDSPSPDSAAGEKPAAASPAYDYSSLPAEPVAVGSLAQLTALVEKAREAQDVVDRAAEELRVATEALRRILEGEIPEAMAAVGMEKFRTRDGLEVHIKQDVQVKQPPVARRAAAYAWLEENGQGGLIKRGVEIAFGAGENEAERAHALADRLGADFPGAVRENQEVNSNSLKAYLVRAVEAGQSPPLELFGARQIRVAKITQR